MRPVYNQERWKGRNVVTLGNRHITSHAFKLLLEYIYTGQVPSNLNFKSKNSCFVKVKVDIKDLSDLNKLAKHCKMSVLHNELDDAYKKAENFGKTHD